MKASFVLTYFKQSVGLNVVIINQNCSCKIKWIFQGVVIPRTTWCGIRCLPLNASRLTNQDSVSGPVKYFLLLYNIQSSSVASLAAYSVDTASKFACEWNCRLFPPSAEVKKEWIYNPTSFTFVHSVGKEGLTCTSCYDCLKPPCKSGSSICFSALRG
jgi:hypothetical protein